MPTVNLSLFSPRWGHNDIYQVDLTQPVMTITLHARVTTCTYVPNQMSQWGGTSTLTATMQNDGIYPSGNIDHLFEHVWSEWRVGQLTDAQAAAELHLLADWINASTNAKPASPFWKQYF